MSETTQAKVDMWQVTTPLLKAMFQQFQELSKKKPEGVLNKPKVAMVNRLLDKCRDVLAAEMTLQFLDLLDTEQLPQNSDVVLLLSQYDSAMKQFHQEHTRPDGYSRRWLVEGSEDSDGDLDDDGENSDEEDEEDEEADDEEDDEN